MGGMASRSLRNKCTRHHARYTDCTENKDRHVGTLLRQSEDCKDHPYKNVVSETRPIRLLT